MSEKPSNRDLLREIQEDLRKLKSDTNSIKVDLQVIKSKIEIKSIMDKKELQRKEADSWWLASFR